MKSMSKGIPCMSTEEAMAFLDSKGIEYEICDTPVPVLGNRVNCGTPSDIGDEMIDGYIHLPKSELGIYPVVEWPARGDSMIDAEIVEGDLLRVELGVLPHDGKVVIASIDNEYTAKVFFTDRSGERWLLPRNKRYDSIHLTAQNNVRIVGMVRDIVKQSPQLSYRECMEIFEATLSRQQRKEGIWEMVQRAVKEGSHLFWAGSSWAVVYCYLRDCHGYEGSVSEFERMAENLILPMKFQHECTPGRVQRTISNHPYMRLHIDKWRENGASVREIVLAEFLKNFKQNLPK